MTWQHRLKEDKEDKRRERAKKAKKGTDAYGNAEYVGYVSYPRTKEVKGQYDAWLANDPPVADLLDAACEMGYKFSLATDKNGGGIKASFYSNDPEREDAGLGISTFSSAGWEATSLCIFFLCVFGAFNLRHEKFTPPGDKANRSFWGG